MRGDKIIIKPHHEKAARGVAELLLPAVEAADRRFAITVAGESGAGKSEVAAALAEEFAIHGITTTILQQDDYFVYPPKTNAEVRRKDINHVGMGEVRLDLMDENLEQALAGAARITKPLVDFDADSIGEELVDLEGIDVLIAEGTYTTALVNADRRVFIDRSYIDTRESRSERAREEQDDYLERILTIEHEIISSHKRRADVIITRDYDVEKAS
jgi:uridine kinase